MGATAEESVLRRVTDTFSLPGKAKSENYSVQHSSAVFLVDPQGRIRAMFGSPQDPKTVAQDFVRIREELS